MNLQLLCLVLQGKLCCISLNYLDLYFTKFLLASLRNTNELKKQDAFKVPRYIDTRMDEVFPARKSRFRMLPGKENAKVLYIFI